LKLPNDPLVLYFFTPFSAFVMSKVINNIQESLRLNSRPLYIVYYGSRQDLIDYFIELNFPHQEIIFKTPLSASGKYKAYLFSWDGGCHNYQALSK